MNREGKWGAAAVIAVLAAIGISTQGGRKTDDGHSQVSAGLKDAPVHHSGKGPKLKTGVCTDLEDLFRAFLGADKNNFSAPDSCYEGANPDPNRQSELKRKAMHLKFVIATLPDPLHTHFALLFDRYAEAIQQAAQDEGYVYDSSWLPWETEEQTYTHLKDQDQADDRKESREDQPGVILFRRDDSTSAAKDTEFGFSNGLLVFVVGEEPTRGIHREQFEHAAEWISKLSGSNVSILGPSFSGSFPSLSQLLASDTVHDSLRDLSAKFASSGLLIYSGAATSESEERSFVKNSTPNEKLKNWNITFHSFVANDEEILKDYCDHLGSLDAESELDAEKKIAFISEDETAYGSQIAKLPESKEETGAKQPDRPCPNALRLYYPRDISSLRAAYQSQSIFSPESQQAEDRPKTNLSSNLADPANQAHDTIPSFSGGQAPLSEEAVLLAIVGALKAHQSQYLVLRYSNSLDPLFLTKFFRRFYPKGRVVLAGTDLLFQRERGSEGLSGIMMLTTYPLMPWGQDWTKWAGPVTGSRSHTHRIFGEDTVEGTYIAGRYLLHGFDDQQAKALAAGNEFLPANPAPADFELPDYAAPFWRVPESCKATVVNSGGQNTARDRNHGIDPSCQKYLRPAVWLSVLGRNAVYPVATFVKDDDNQLEIPPAPNDQWRDSWKMPVSIVICWVIVFGIALFHAVCCSWASFTRKPAFLAHFALAASPCGLSRPWRHRVLIALGAAFIATAALFCAWACGAFPKSPVVYLDRYWALALFSVACLIALLAVSASQATAERLASNEVADETPPGSNFPAITSRQASVKLWARTIPVLIFVLATALAYVFCIRWIEQILPSANRIPAYWRGMNLTSGVSPILPFLFLVAGLYVWFWYSLHGLALFGPDRPRLPQRSELRLKGEILCQDFEKSDFEIKGLLPKYSVVLRMFSQEDAGALAEQWALPWGDRQTAIFATAIFAVALALLLLFGAPIRSLGTSRYATVFCVALAFCFTLMLAEAWQLCRIWSRLRQLLVFLDRLPLRRTLQGLHGFSWGSIWKMSGNVLDVRYKLLSRQVESLNHLRKNLDDLPQLSEHEDFMAAKSCIPAAEDARIAMRRFAPWYSAKHIDPNAGNLALLEAFQKSIATLAGCLITRILISAWHEETRSLILDLSNYDKDSPRSTFKLPLADLPEHIRNAEELVCLPYLGFVQNILGRIRTLVLGIICLFVATTLSVAFYPFDPRDVISYVMMLLFVVLGTVISYVYADMHRDSTLSHITNTNPGELGADFWFKLIGFGLGPVLGLLATAFPGMADFLLSWVEPGLTSLK
jgi:hypothetical protein